MQRGKRGGVTNLILGHSFIIHHLFHITDRQIQEKVHDYYKENSRVV